MLVSREKRGPFNESVSEQQRNRFIWAMYNEVRSTVSTVSTLRKFLFLTLSHAENKGVSKEEIRRRITGAFLCRSVIVAQEKHRESQKHPPLGSHFHVAVLNKNASKNNATQILRKLFPEFEGRQCQVTFHKSFHTMCAYVFKEDPSPLVWGEYSMKELLSFAQMVQKKVKQNTVTPRDILQQLMECREWLDVYDRPDLANQIVLRYGNLKKAHADLQLREMQRSSFAERLVSYLHGKGWPQEYEPEEILEKYILLDWIACQLIFNRPIKTKQMFVYGAPSTQKTLLLNFLARALRIYFSSARTNDFTGADDFYDLWVFDEFQEGADGNDLSQENTLFKILDGQECRLDAKYKELFLKKRNVPIILIANKMPSKVRCSGPMRERLMRLRFLSQIPHLQEERIIATLWGCVERRIQQQFHLNCTDIFLQYNSANVLLRESGFPALRNSRPTLFHVYFPQNDSPGCLGALDFCERESEHEYQEAKTFDLFEVLILLYPQNAWTPIEQFDLLQFALIPLKPRRCATSGFAPLKKKKDEEQNENPATIPVFLTCKMGTHFHIFRPEDGKHLLIWPVYASYVSSKHRQREPKRSDLPVKIEPHFDCIDCDFCLAKAQAEEAQAEEVEALKKKGRRWAHEKSRHPFGMWKLQLGVPGNSSYNDDWNETD